MKKLYHATIHAKLEEILKEGAILPGKESVIRPNFDFIGNYSNYSEKHVYAWTDKKSSIDNALNLSRTAHPGIYSDKDRIPVIIPFSVDENFIEKDPDCGGNVGVMVKGSIKKFENPILLKLQKSFYKVSKFGDIWCFSYNN